MNGKPKDLSQAIDEMEKQNRHNGNGNGHGLDELKARLESEFHRLEDTLNSLKPDLEDLKERAQSQAKKAKNKVEEEVHKNLWTSLGVVGLVFFVIGFLFGSRRSRSRD